MIKRIIFDLDGTLIRGNYEELGKYYQTLDNSIDEAFVSNLNRYLMEYEEHNKKYSYKELFNFLDSKTTRKLKYECYLSMLEHSADIEKKDLLIDKKILKELACKYEIYVLTNWFYDIQMKKLQKAGISKYITKVISGETLLKPNKKAYELCTIGLNKSECVFVGDNYFKDILVPLKSGYKTIWYNPLNDSNGENGIEINDLKKVLNVIEKV